MTWSPAPGARPPRKPITTAPPAFPPLLPILHVAALLGVVGWAVFVTATTDPWQAMGLVSLTCALAYKLVAMVEAARAAERAKRLEFETARVECTELVEQWLDER